MDITGAVTLFATIKMAAEMVVLGMIPPRYRLRILGSRTQCTVVHLIFGGTLFLTQAHSITGTMSGLLALVCSTVTILIARCVFSFIQYHEVFVDRNNIRRYAMWIPKEDLPRIINGECCIAYEEKFHRRLLGYTPAEKKLGRNLPEPKWLDDPADIAEWRAA